MSRFDNYETVQHIREINKAHAEALRVNKLGKAMAKKAVEMVESGRSAKPIGFTQSMRMTWQGIDLDSATVALNGELRSQGEGIRAQIVNKWDGDSYGAEREFIEITEIDGVAIKPESTPGWYYKNKPVF